MLTKPCFYLFGNALRVLHFYCAHFQAILSFNKIFINKFFNTILKVTGACIQKENSKKKKKIAMYEW